MRLTGDWLIHPGTQAVCSAIQSAGYRALFVGGCVRDALLNRPVRDIDIATDARPEMILDIAKAAGIKAIPTGFDHGTVTLVAKGRPHEITTFRRDIETDGRHASVDFSTDVTEDAARRDFTMNALYATPDGAVVDPLNGLDDLLARRLRFVGIPADRIAEDYLRILRFFRFFAWYGDVDQGMDPDALAAIADGADGLNALSRERVGAEMRKLLAAPDPTFSVAAMRQCGVLARVVPGADDHGLGLLIHLEDGRAPEPMRRLAILGGTPEDALRLSRAEARLICDLRDGIGDMSGPGGLGYRLGLDRAIDVILLRAATFETPVDPRAFDLARRGSAAKFPVKAADLMPALKGPALGACLKELEQRWIASDFTLSREDLLAD